MSKKVLAILLTIASVAYANGPDIGTASIPSMAPIGKQAQTTPSTHNPTVLEQAIEVHSNTQNLTKKHVLNIVTEFITLRDESSYLPNLLVTWFVPLIVYAATNFFVTQFGKKGKEENVRFAGELGAVSTALVMMYCDKLINKKATQYASNTILSPENDQPLKINNNQQEIPLTNPVKQ